MSKQFEVPAKPWGEKEIKAILANIATLSDEVKVELGLLKSAASAPDLAKAKAEAEAEAAKTVAAEAAAKTVAAAAVSVNK